MMKKIAPLTLILLALSVCGRSEHDVRIQESVSGILFHDHANSATYRQLRSGIRKFPLQVVNGHDHFIEISEDQFSVIESGLPITIQSTENQFHKHDVVLQKLD